MNKIDFSHPGGFPLTQDELDFMQQSYISCIEALAAAGVNGTAPTVLTGMIVSITGVGATAVTSGWFIYGGELIQFTGGSVMLPGGLGYVPLILITDNTTNLTYNDTTSFPAHHVKTATIIAGPNITDATHFPVSALVPWVIIDPTLYNDVATLTSALATINAGWISDTWVALVTPFTSGSITGGTIVYNKYKYINHKTYAWQAQVTGCTITGAPGAIRIHAAGVYLAGGVWQNPGAKIMTSTVDFGGSLYNLVTQLNLDTSGGMVVDCNINGIAWGAATGVNFNINLIAEV